MTHSLSEIKKELYRRDVQAAFYKAKKGNLYYEAFVKMEGYSPQLSPVVQFLVPFSDIGDAEFLPTMAAKHLIRYIVQSENITT